MINFDKGIGILSLVNAFNKKFDLSSTHYQLGKFSKLPLTKSKSKVINKLLLLMALFCINTLKSSNYYFSSNSGNDSYSNIEAQSP